MKEPNQQILRTATPPEICDVWPVWELRVGEYRGEAFRDAHGKTESP